MQIYKDNIKFTKFQSGIELTGYLKFSDPLLEQCSQLKHVFSSSSDLFLILCIILFP